MSQENVEMVRAAIDAYNRGDLNAVLQDAAPSFELDMSRAIGPWSGIFKLDQVRRVLDEFIGGWTFVRIEPHEFVETDDLVVVPVTMHVKGRDGIEAAAHIAAVFTICDGAIERVVTYQERREALEAVGLSEQPPV